MLTPGVDPEYVPVPSVTPFALMLALGLVERARRRTEFEREMKRIQLHVESNFTSYQYEVILVMFGIWRPYTTHTYD